MKIEKMGQKAAAAISILMLIGLFIGFADFRYASATDVADIQQSVLEGRIASLENSLLNVEFQIIQLSAAAAMNDTERAMLAALQLRRETLIRDLQALRRQNGV